MKGQAVLERGFIYTVVLALAVVIVVVMLFFFSHTNLNGSFSVTSIRINHLTSNTLDFSVVLSKKISNPSTLKFFINDINHYFSVAGMNMSIVLMPNGEYEYIFDGPINSSTYSLLNNTSNEFVLASYKNVFGKTIFSEIAYPISSVSNTSANVNQITFYIYPDTTDFGISLSGYQTLIENGQTLDLGNGQYTITAVQTNPNSNYFFSNWEYGIYSGYINLYDPNNITAYLYVKNASGYVVLFLGQYGPINFTSNENNLINAQNIYQCGMPNSRFCIDNSVRNLYYVYHENKTAFSFAYPPYFSTSNPYERLGFVGYYKSLYSCSLPSQSNVQTDQGISAFCTVNATYEPEYYITAKSSNSSYGLVAIKFFNGTMTPYGAEESGWAEVNTTNVFYAKPSPENLTSMKGYQFVSWNGTYYSTENPFYATIKGVTNETAVFKQCQLYSLTVNTSNATMGSVSPSGTSYYCAGTTVELQAYPNSGYEFTGWSGTYSSSDNPFSIVINSNTIETANFQVQPPPPPPPPPPPAGTYYIYGCVVNTAGTCISSMNGTTYNIAVGNYNTSTSSSTNVKETTFPYPAGGVSGSLSSPAYFNVATTLTDSKSDTYTLQEISGVGLCNYEFSCSGTYTPYISWYGGSSRIAEYLCTGPGCPTGNGGGGGGSKPSNYTYLLVYNSVENTTGSQISGSSDVSQSPGAYSATYINSNHPSLYPPVGSKLAFDEYYPDQGSSSYAYQFYKDSQKVIYEYPSPTLPGHPEVYGFCWLNSSTNSSDIPTDFINMSQVVNGTPCSLGSATYSYSVQKDIVNATYKLVPKKSIITIETIPGNAKEYLVMSTTNSQVTFTCSNSTSNGIKTSVCALNYPPGTQSFTIKLQPNNYPSSSIVNYYYLDGPNTNGWTQQKNDPSQAYSFTGTAGDSYTFYVSLPIPVNITTDFLGNPTSFGSYFGWSTVPYNTNLLGFSNTDTNKTQTVYGFSSLPSSFPSGGNYPSTSYYVDEGFWNNGNFNDSGGIIANDGSPFGCFFSYPEISYCLATDGNLEATTSFTTSYQYWQQHISIGSGFYTLRGLYTFNPSYTGAYLSLPQVPVEYNIMKGIYNNLQLTNYPTNIALNYGYYMPIYLGFNDNITYKTILGNEQVGNCDFLNKKTYYTISAYLYNMSNNQSWICDEHLHPIKTSPSGIIYGALVTQPTQTLTISIYQNQEEATYQANETNGVYQIGDSASYLTGFTSTPNLEIEGADTTYRYVNQYEYQVGVTGIPSLSEENAYGFYSTIAK